MGQWERRVRRPVAELADAADLKSAEFTLIRVQVPAGLVAAAAAELLFGSLCQLFATSSWFVFCSHTSGHCSRLVSMLEWVSRLHRRGKQFLAIVVDAGVLALAMWAALAARLEAWWPQLGDRSIVWLCLSAVAVGLPCFYAAGLYREITRYIGLRFAVRVAYAVTCTAVIFAFIAWMNDPSRSLPRSAIIGFWMATLLGVGGSRAVARHLIRSIGSKVRSRIIIYGASDLGAGLVSLLSQDQKSLVVAFVDDDPSRVGSSVCGVPVHASAKLETVARETGADTVLLALPESCRRRRRELFQQLTTLGIRVMLVPTMSEIADGTARVDSLRALRIQDLLGRPSVEPMTELLTRDTSSANVLITGAGGSIGSEIARKVLRLGPRRLVLLDSSEFNLYTIETELRRNAPQSGGSQIVPVLASVMDTVRMERVMAEHAIDTVYHAAAYKHVPIVEANEIEGIATNAIGTLRTAQAAQRMGVKSFVLISTDKAVRPTSVMGASKRLAEKCLQALAQLQTAVPGTDGSPARDCRTRFTMVRFGNVLDSSGSVVPLFMEQIRRGGPITLTDEGITRYFMTIPEAATLVIQAGSMGSGGDVFVLDMGEPVKIIDLARNMIQLAGYKVKDKDHPAGDIEIVVTGLRPGEKLYEELLIDGNCIATEHPGIFRANEPFVPWPELETKLGVLESALDRHDVADARRQLQAIVSGYRLTQTVG